jgi:hypothetical protein
MKAIMFSAVVLLLLSCKSDLATNAVNLTGKYYSRYYTLTIKQDSTITYEERLGCFWGTFDGKWTYLNSKKIQLIFPDCMDVLELLGPNMCGQKVQVEIVGNSTLKMDKTILTRE